MKHRDLMPHTNSTLAVVTFKKSEVHPGELDVTIHHVVGWAIGTNKIPCPIATNESPEYFTKNKWYTFFQPSGTVLDFPEKGDATPLEEAIKAMTQKLILLAEPADDADKRKKYDH